MTCSLLSLRLVSLILGCYLMLSYVVEASRAGGREVDPGAVDATWALTCGGCGVALYQEQHMIYHIMLYNNISYYNCIM